MKNREKYTTHIERAIAHQKWCKEKAEQGWRCTLDCDPCYLKWLKMKAEEEKKNEK